jgi:hypothetical protein
MNVHKKLTKSCHWYRDWHKKPYAGFVHILILLSFFSYNIYLLLEIYKHVQKI